MIDYIAVARGAKVTDPPITVTGYRTTLLPGQAQQYRVTHAAIPDEIATQLLASGIQSWRIWIDGETLFHSIETSGTLDEVMLRMSESGVRNVAWDALIDTLVDSRESTKGVLPMVWRLDGTGQSAN